MTNLSPRLNLGVFVLAGAGAGALAGVAVGLLTLRQTHAPAPEEISDTVDDLKRRAELILTELSRSPVPDAVSATAEE